MHSCTVQNSTLYVAIDSQVCFHRRLFANPMKLHWCITGPVKSLESINQNWWGTKLLPISVLIYPVDCVHLCHLLRIQYHCLSPDGRENPPSACPPTPTTPFHPPTPLYMTPVIIQGVVRNYQKLVVNTVWQSQLWNTTQL